MTLTPSKLKVAELRQELESRGLATEGLKKDLVQRLQEALDATEGEAPKEEMKDTAQEEKAGDKTKKLATEDDLPETPRARTTRTPKKGKTPTKREPVEKEQEEPEVKAEEVSTDPEVQDTKAVLIESPKSPKKSPNRQEIKAEEKDETPEETAPMALDVVEPTAEIDSANDLEITDKTDPVTPAEDLKQSENDQTEEMVVETATKEDVSEPTPDEPLEQAETPMEVEEATPVDDTKIVLLVKNLTRPFTIVALKDLLAEFGEVVDFWTNKIKTHCYATYSDAHQAQKSSKSLSGKQWPEVTGKNLETSVLTKEEADKAIEDEKTGKAVAKSNITRNGLFNRASAAAHQSTKFSNPQVSHSPVDETQSQKEDTEIQPASKPHIPIDKLFKKTNTKPHIYYLPVSHSE